uniref:Vacuolar protein sorting-associated protein 29 n=1 Tax=Panagrellus redivivus TaxID=6233 RepID=A0A7E5A0A5_PANRE
MLVLVIGDLHVPLREHSLPPKFKKLLVPNKMQHILCTGNLISREMLDYLRSLSNDIHVVRGDFDNDSSLPETKIITIGAFRVGLIHGHQVIPWGDIEALELTARQLNVDVLVSGNTHKAGAFMKDGITYVNPGSATGAFSTITEGEIIPSFSLLDIRGDVIAVYTYNLVDDDVKVDRFSYDKSKKPVSQ